MYREISLNVHLTQEQNERLEILTKIHNCQRTTAIPLSEDEMLEVIITAQCFQHIGEWIKNTELVTKGFNEAEKSFK